MDDIKVSFRISVFYLRLCLTQQIYAVILDLGAAEEAR